MAIVVWRTAAAAAGRHSSSSYELTFRKGDTGKGVGLLKP